MKNLEIKINTIFKKLFQLTDSKMINAKINSVEKWDSLTHINLILEIEKEFKLKKISTKVISKLNSYKEIFKYLKKNAK